MPKFHFNKSHQNAKPEVKGGDAPDENLRVVGPDIQSGHKPSGVYQHRPRSASLILTRTIPEKTGALLFLQAAIGSLGWDNTDKKKGDADKFWPTLSVTYDKVVAQNTVDVQRCDMQRLVVLTWSLTWQGEGPGGRQGTGFTESAMIQAWNLTRTALVGDDRNKPIALNLAPPREG